MHLSAIRLRGFKSFREPIELRFESGVSVVVGPNGSGKSNIADALQWAMASQPPSQIRAQTGQDVLFAGSEQHAPSGVCEVELGLDNSDGRVGVPRSELSVMRRLDRSGDSDYLLNRQSVRRLDVRDLLAEAGLGRELHCIIAQGTVDQVLLARPDERRGLVEEAAGLGKFKRRRQRAEAKLARVAADLERAGDVERELRARLKPLELQATAAERAEALGRQIAEVRLRLLASALAETRRTRSERESELVAARSERDAASARLAEITARRAQAEEELARILSEQESAAAHGIALATAVERLGSRRDALAQRLADVAAEAARERELADRLGAEASALALQADAAVEAAERLSAAEGALAPVDEAELATAAARAGESGEAALAARRQAAELTGRAAHAEAALAAQRTRSTQIAERHEGARLAAERTRAELAAAEAALAQAEPAAVSARAAHESALAAEGSARAEVDALRGRVRDAQRGAAEAASASAAAAARAEALAAAVERADGIAPSLSELVRRGATLALALVEPEAGYELAVAAALERGAALACADDLESALALLESAEAEGGALHVGRPAGADLPAPAGAVPLATHVRLSDRAPAGLLAGVWLVTDAAALVHVASGIAVTRDGLGYDADRGVAFRSGASGEAALLRARRELEGARAGAESGAAESALRESESAVATAELDAREASEAAHAEALTQARAALIAAERAEREAVADRDRAARAAERAEHELVESDRQGQDLATSIETAERESAELLRSAAAAGDAAARADAEHAELEQVRSAQAERVAHARAERAAVAERAEHARRERDRLVAARAAAERNAGRTRERGEALALLASGDGAALSAALDACRLVAEQARAPLVQRGAELTRRSEALTIALRECARDVAEHAGAERDAAVRAGGLEREAAHAEERLAELRTRAAELAEQNGLAAVDAVEPLPPEELAGLSARVERLERRRGELGAVNPLAKQELEEQRERLDDVRTQVDDLAAAMRELERVIRSLTREIRERFATTFAQVQEGFDEVVGTLFPGGRGRCVLTDAEPIEEVADESGEASEPAQAADPAEPGVELEIQPAGKRLASMGLLSGGERSLGALAFLFALMLARPSPFYVLDEVDAALDDANISRFLELIERYRERAQFIIITHQQLTMEIADVLYGVSMAGDGVSTVLSRRAREAVAV
ncbi:MAG: chromosome segregation protein [Gaiellales bacterium]|nr:chromosome segregation protein [Gaiellales bacterium]